MRAKHEKANQPQQPIKPGDGIPVDRAPLYAKPVDWSRMERGDVLKQKIVPWVETKIIEEFGVSEPRLVNMICSKISQRERPETIEAELIKVWCGVAGVGLGVGGVGVGGGMVDGCRGRPGHCGVR